MTHHAFDDDGARAIRAQWFRYLDTIEPARGDLHAYCLRLTGSVWDAEDLVQDTLLKGFGMTARGDFHGETSPVRNIKAYLFRTATNGWLDVQRRARYAAPGETGVHDDADPAETRDAVDKALALTSPQEFAAILLKDVYDFTLDEVADFIGTSLGTVKSALGRARRKMQDRNDAHVDDDAGKALVGAFVDAINSGDVDRVVNLMAEKVQIKVCNVGGGRGRDGIWTEKSLGAVSARIAECDGQAVVLMFRDRDPNELYDVLRLEGDDTVCRIIDHCYAPETLKYVAGQLGYACSATACHQPWDVIESDMVPTTFLPWIEP